MREAVGEASRRWPDDGQSWIKGVRRPSPSPARRIAEKATWRFQSAGRSGQPPGLASDYITGSRAALLEDVLFHFLDPVAELVEASVVFRPHRLEAFLRIDAEALQFGNDPVHAAVEA